ncbi:hypothetical protein HC766_02975 [Candidatus Gracilibacteria bacterium]|nr:hypothetical protein [Thermales bacterium]NJL96878.1 hypothetical protein [Candidatus Gracilibacteria bacterium]NJS41320.1 hypothetical protein [Candidatus Gracilibacteria bacterium]
MILNSTNNLEVIIERLSDSKKMKRYESLLEKRRKIEQRYSTKRSRVYDYGSSLVRDAKLSTIDIQEEKELQSLANWFSVQSELIFVRDPGSGY